jgi:hypothetical protein
MKLGLPGGFRALLDENEDPVGRIERSRERKIVPPKA